MHNNSPIGLEPGGPISPHEHVELDFLRYENAHLQTRLRDLERQVNLVTVERDTIQHERSHRSRAQVANHREHRWTYSGPKCPLVK